MGGILWPLCVAWRPPLGIVWLSLLLWGGVHRPPRGTSVACCRLAWFGGDHWSFPHVFWLSVSSRLCAAPLSRCGTSSPGPKCTAESKVRFSSVIPLCTRHSCSARQVSTLSFSAPWSPNSLILHFWSQNSLILQPWSPNSLILPHWSSNSIILNSLRIW